MSFVDGKLILAYQELATVPVDFIKSFGDIVYTLDVSHNNIRNVQFLENFKNLTSLIMDHNLINAETVFPVMPSVTVLWLNYNNIKLLYPFVRNLHVSFPSLKHLSLMGNEIVPPCREDTFYGYIQYRMFLLSWFDRLEHLDDRSVTSDELIEARRLYGRPFLERIQLPKIFQSTLSALRQLVERGKPPSETES